MKKITTVFVSFALFIGQAAYSQYYTLPNFCINSNPGGVNKDIEEPGTITSAGWSVIATTNANPVWSSTGTIPFSFKFNGSPYTQYKVSTSGVLTFDLSAATPPSSTNAALPDASIPNNSICCWGLTASGSNDQIATKTFGTTPNRQHWIWFNSYTYPECTTPFTYWAIVLEETTNKIYIVDQRTYCSSGTPISLTLGIQIDNTTAYSVAGSPNVGSMATSQAGSYDGPNDNIWYELGQGTLFGNDASVYNTATINYSLVNTPVSILADMVNRGTNTINSFTANYSINAGAPVSGAVSSSPITTGSCYSFAHPTQWTPTLAGTYTVRIWTSNLNGNPDQYPANDTVTKIVTIVNSFPVHLVTVEEGTGTWCGWCPRRRSIHGFTANNGWQFNSRNCCTQCRSDDGVSL